MLTLGSQRPPRRARPARPAADEDGLGSDRPREGHAAAAALRPGAAGRQVARARARALLIRSGS